jgi:parallel beta-helix repeat protein
MTVKATIDSTLNGQSADLILIEDGDTRSYESKALAGGTETLIFTGLDGGEDKEYTAKIVPSTSDVTQTSEVNFGATVDIDPIPHRDVDADSTIRETAEFNNGVSAKALGLGDSPLINGLLTSALNDGEVLADDGYVYSTVQAAQDAASSWIFIGPGTFNESVTIDTAGLTVQGSGHNTLIDGTSNTNAINVGATDVTISSLRVDVNTDNGGQGILSNAAKTTIINTYVSGGQFRTIEADDVDAIVSDCICEDGGIGIEIGLRGIVSNNTVRDMRDTDAGIKAISDDAIISNNTVTSPNGDGINTGGGNDCIVIGNRVHNAGDRGIYIHPDSIDIIVANNRVSDSTNSDLGDDGTGTLFDGNNTGASN